MKKGRFEARCRQRSGSLVKADASVYKQSGGKPLRSMQAVSDLECEGLPSLLRERLAAVQPESPDCI